MEKILNIDGKDVKFKSTASFLLRYKMQFQRDGLKDLLRLQGAIDLKTPHAQARRQPRSGRSPGTTAGAGIRCANTGQSGRMAARSVASAAGARGRQ